MYSEKDKKIKVLIVCNDFYVGGAQRLISQQIKNFDQERFNIELVLIMKHAPERATLERELPKDLVVTRINMHHWYYPDGLIGLFKTLRKTEPDVVFSHLFLSNMLTRLFKPFLRYKVFTVEHNTYTNKKRWQVWVDCFLARFSEKVIAVSQEVADFTVKQQKVSRDKIVVIPNGIDFSIVDTYCNLHNKEEIRHKFGIPDTAKVFLSVGRLTVQKNHQFMIDAFKDFSRKHSEVKLYILGEGALLNELKQQAAGSSNIVLEGNVSNVFDYYLASDFLLSTSHIEGMSMAYLEALAFGLPIIATQTGGAKELIQDNINGFVIPTNSREFVVEVLEKARKGDERSLSENARKIAEQYSVAKNIAKYEELALVGINRHD